MASREVEQKDLSQGIDEEIPYGLTTTPWNSSPTSPVVVIWDITDPDAWVDKSSTMLSGSASAAADVITTPVVKSLVAGHTYRLEIKWTVGSAVLETHAKIEAEK